MARNAGVVVETKFTNGLVTEATGLNFPENAVTDTNNCVFDPIGSVYRRDGIDQELGSVPFTTVSQENVVVEYLWESVAGNGDLTFLVQQIGNTIYVFNVDGTTPISNNQLWAYTFIGSVTDSSLFPIFPCQFASGLGRLLIAHPYSEPIYVTFDPDDGSFVATLLTIKTRDFKGVLPWPVAARDQAPVISPERSYNLFNQGWRLDRQSEFRNKAGFYPSDYEVWWLYKRPDQYGNEVFLPTDIFSWQAALSNLDRGNSPAPRGSVILSEFYQDRSAASQLGGIPVVTSGPNRPSTVAFHAGRVFFAGVQHPDYNSKIYFSQIVESPEQFALAHQANDPTSQYSPDLLPSDGGVVAIPEIGSVIKLWSINNSLLVIATNGVWEITGSSGIGFTAIDYTVKKISSLTTVSSYSFVNVKGAPIWWGQDGIYSATSQGEVGGIQINNISEAKIKGFFFDIPETSRRYVKGAFDPKEQIVQWVYRDTLASTIKERFTFDRILNLDITSGAYYPWSIPTSGAAIKGIFCSRGSGSALFDENVVDNSGVQVTDNDGFNVTIEVSISVPNSAEFKYTTVLNSSDTWLYSESDEGSRADWTTLQSPSGVPFESFFVTGYQIRGSALTKGQKNYIRFFNEGEGQFYFYSRWDYRNSGDSGRWGSPQQVVFDDDLVDVQTRRRKVRGHGLVLQLAIHSIGTNDFNVIGWSSFDTSNARP